jgi:hypothetical protein
VKQEPLAELASSKWVRVPKSKTTGSIEKPLLPFHLIVQVDKRTQGDSSLAPRRGGRGWREMERRG